MFKTCKSVSQLIKMFVWSSIRRSSKNENLNFWQNVQMNSNSFLMFLYWMKSKFFVLNLVFVALPILNCHINEYLTLIKIQFYKNVINCEVYFKIPSNGFPRFFLNFQIDSWDTLRRNRDLMYQHSAACVEY